MNLYFLALFSIFTINTPSTKNIQSKIETWLDKNKMNYTIYSQPVNCNAADSSKIKNQDFYIEGDFNGDNQRDYCFIIDSIVLKNSEIRKKRIVILTHNPKEEFYKLQLDTLFKAEKLNTEISLGYLKKGAYSFKVRPEIDSRVQKVNLKNDCFAIYECNSTKFTLWYFTGKRFSNLIYYK